MGAKITEYEYGRAFQSFVVRFDDDKHFPVSPSECACGWTGNAYSHDKWTLESLEPEKAPEPFDLSRRPIEVFYHTAKSPNPTEQISRDVLDLSRRPIWRRPDAPEPETKQSNPKDAVGIKKVPFSTVSARVVAELGLAMMEGALKYSRHNYRKAGVRASVYYDAAFRHLTAWWEGQDIDPDSGLSHLTKAMGCLHVIRDSQLMQNWVDDRPPRHPDHETWIADLNARAKALLAKYPEPPEACTEANRGK